MNRFEVPWDFVLDVLVVLLLFGAGFHLYQGRQVLSSEGCSVYWSDFKGGFEGQLVNRTEAQWFHEYGSTKPPSSVNNQSFKEQFDYSRVIE